MIKDLERAFLHNGYWLCFVTSFKTHSPVNLTILIFHSEILLEGKTEETGVN